jgi:hypothetical protein
MTDTTISLAHGVLFVKYASVLLQAMTVQLDEDFVFALYDLTKLKGVSWTEEDVNKWASRNHTDFDIDRS